MHHVLTTDDLPLAELSAMRLDGELVAVDRCFAPFDEFPSPRQRASALVGSVHDRLIAERRTAAWIWGALDPPPAIHEFCTAWDARVTRRPAPHLTIREVVLGDDDVQNVAGLPVTTPRRTVADLVRFTESWTPAQRSMVERLLAIGKLRADDIVRDLDRHKLPHKKRAVERLRGLSPS